MEPFGDKALRPRVHCQMRDLVPHIEYVCSSIYFIHYSCKTRWDFHHCAKNRYCCLGAVAIMGQPSYQASNALIYLTYGAFLYDKILTPGSTLRPATDKSPSRRVTGVWIAWLWRGQSKKDFLANNRTQKGQIQSHCFAGGQLCSPVACIPQICAG